MCAHKGRHTNNGKARDREAPENRHDPYKQTGMRNEARQTPPNHEPNSCNGLPKSTHTHNHTHLACTAAGVMCGATSVSKLASDMAESLD
jgi:hypothetical protein